MSREAKKEKLLDLSILYMDKMVKVANLQNLYLEQLTKQAGVSQSNEERIFYMLWTNHCIREQLTLHRMFFLKKYYFVAN